MNEELLRELEAEREIVEDVQETVVDTDTSGSDTGESDNAEVVAEDAKPAKFEPWKIKTEAKIPDSIPYDRFKEINDERTAYKNRLEQYEAELAAIKAEKEKLAKIKGPEDINIADYDDVDQYMKDVIEATKRTAIAEVEKNYQEREMRRVEEARATEIVKSFQDNIAEAAKYNPDVEEAARFIDSYADSIDPRIAKELLIDENAGELIYDIVTDQALLNKMFKGDVDDFIRTMHKMSARIDKEARRAGGIVTATAKKDTTPVPTALDKKAAIKKSIPSTIKGDARTTTKDPDKMSMAEFKEYVRNGYK